MNFYLGTRRSSMASSSTSPAAANPNSIKDDFPEALTYRYNDNSAWVPAAKSHDASFLFSFCLLYYTYSYLMMMGAIFFSGNAAAWLGCACAYAGSY